MNRVLIAAGLLAAMLGLSACETMNTTERAQPTYQRKMIQDKRIETDPDLSGKVQIVGINESRTPDGFLRIQVELYNTTSTSHPFHYKFEWFDATGTIIPSNTPSYVQRQIIGRESMFIVAVAPTPQANDFRLKLLED